MGGNIEFFFCKAHRPALWLNITNSSVQVQSEQLVHWVTQLHFINVYIYRHVTAVNPT